MSVDDFTDRLRADIKKLANEAGKDENSEAGRGYAFQLWFAQLAAAYENYDVDPEDAVVIGAGDLKADIVLEDETRKHLLVCQCKYESIKRKSTVDETPVNDFFTRHSQFCNRDWVRKHGSEQARELLLDYGDKMEDGYKATFYFVTTAMAASDRVWDLVSRVNADYAARKIPVTCQLIDFKTLKDYYVRAQTKDQSPPERVQIRLMPERYFEKTTPHHTLVATLKGSTLRDLYKQHKETLFNFNIRGYLGSRGINDQIRETAESNSAEFFYFNNGVSAICTKYDVDKDVVSADGFQIINGAQTVGTIARAKFGDSLEVLFRLTQAKSVKSEKGFNRSDYSVQQHSECNSRIRF